MKQAIALCALAASAAMAQSTITGSKTMQGSWDASGAAATKPAKSGATLPATCNTGEFFFNTSAAAGQNLYLCQPANTWTQASSGPGSVSSVFGRTGAVAAQSGDYTFSQISGTANATQLPAEGGDLSGTVGSTTVKAIQGKAVSTTAPSNGQVLTWNGSQWVPQTSSPSLGGDLSGTASAATVKAIQGQALSGVAPGLGQVLTWGGSSWGPQNASGGSGGSSTSQEIVFDGNTTTLSDGSTVTWSACATNGQCATWTVPSGVYWVAVELWAGGGPGLGAANGNGGAGGPGGGYGHRVCPVSAGGTITVQVGMGGISGTGYGASVTQGGDSGFGACIGASAGVMSSIYSYGNAPGALKINGQAAPAGPFLTNNGYYNNLVVLGSSSLNQVAGYVAVREDQGGWPGSGWSSGSTGAGYPAGPAIGGGGGGGGGASQNATGGAAGTSVYGGVGGTGGSSGAACTAGSIPGGGGGGAYVPASGASSGCNGARGEVRVFYVR